MRTLRQGLINSLGARRDEKAVRMLALVLPDSADALAAIGTREALATLKTAKPRPSAALLRCALRVGDAAVLESLCAADQPKAIRVAAFLGRVALSGDKAGEAVLAALRGNDPALQAAAIGQLRGRAVVQAAAERLAALPADLQVPLLVVLGRSGETVALPAVTQAASSPDPAVRRAAISAMGPLGDESSVPVLLGLLERARADREEQIAILEALTRLRGPGVDAALLKAPQRETLRVVVARGTKTAVPALFALAEKGDADAIAALGKLLDAGDGRGQWNEYGPRLIALLDTAADRQAVEAALTAVYRRAGDAQPVVDAAAKATGPRKASLIAVLGGLGGDKALAALRGALKGDDAEVKLAAVRALSDWDSGAPLADLQAIAETATDARLKALAVRGVARLETYGIDVSGMPNLATGGTATNPDGLRSDGQGGPPSAAIDGVSRTYWDEVDNQKLYQLRIQMKRPATVRALRIEGFQHQQYAPKDFEVVCDDKVVKTVKDAVYRENLLIVVLPPTHCTTIQLNITGSHGPSPAIRELGIYGKAD